MILYIDAEPMAKQSDRSGIIRKKDGTMVIHHYQNSKLTNKIKEIKKKVKEQLPDEFNIMKGKLHVRKLHFIFEVPKTNKADKKKVNEIGYIYKDTKPDLDNLEKMIWDCLNGVVFEDDKQIVRKDNIAKLYGKKNQIIIDIDYLQEQDYSYTGIIFANNLIGGL